MAPTNAEPRYNILSIESGDFSALIMAKFVNFLEQRSYMQAQVRSCLPDKKERPEKRIAISEMFDMVAGSETGAIIAASIATKNKNATLTRKNALYADTALKFFEEYGDVLYRDAYLSSGVKFFLLILFSTIGGYLGYKIAFFFITIPQYEEVIDKLKQYCNQLQKLYIYKSQLDVSDEDQSEDLLKKKEATQNVVSQVKKDLRDLLKDTSIIDKYQIYFIQIIRNEKDIQTDRATRTVALTEIFDEIDDAEETYKKYQMLKYIAMFLMTYIFFMVAQNSLTGYSFFFMSTKELSTLQEKIISDSFIPADSKISEVVTDEILLTSWDINSRTPRFFTKWADEN